MKGTLLDIWYELNIQVSLINKIKDLRKNLVSSFYCTQLYDNSALPVTTQLLLLLC